MGLVLICLVVLDMLQLQVFVLLGGAQVDYVVCVSSGLHKYTLVCFPLFARLEGISVRQLAFEKYVSDTLCAHASIVS